MQIVSQEWKNAQEQIIVPESFVEILFQISNPEAQNDANVQENGKEYFCEPQEIVESLAKPVKYAMLEPGLWILDGTYRVVGGSIEPPVEEYEGFIPADQYVTLITSNDEQLFAKAR